MVKDLHWLQIKERIEYKILVIVHKCLYNNAPPDLSLTISKSLCERSVYLNVPTFHSSYGERSFSVAGPRLWNSLPVDIRNTVKIGSFKKSLKTHLFKKCYSLYEQYSSILFLLIISFTFSYSKCMITNFNFSIFSSVQ